MSRNHLTLEGQHPPAIENTVQHPTVAIPYSGRQETGNDVRQFKPGRSLSNGAPETGTTGVRVLLRTNNRVIQKQILPNRGNSPSLSESNDQWANASDTTLVECVKSGNHSAYSELVKRHSTLAFRIAYRITQNRQDAEDAMQDSLFRAFNRINSFDRRSAFATWLTRIAINTSLMILRKRRKHASTSLDGDEEIGLQIRDPVPSPELLMVRLERNAAVRDAVRRLPPLLRSSIEARYWKEMSTHDVATLNEVSVAAAKSRQLRGRRELRTMLDQVWTRPTDAPSQ
jgi:RNA polymerase sigma-70 factor (ECF subfamily)